ncbi:MAG: arginase [Planctomycetota bacterium]|nr:arginase [Planctomycetota bacterium]
MTKRRKVGILGVPLDLGAGRRGTDMGPSAIRLAGVRRRLARFCDVTDHGSIHAAEPEVLIAGDETMRFAGEIAATCARLRDGVVKILDDGETPLVLGGDHSIAMGSAAGAAAWLAKRDESLGVLWVDAHADLNTPESTPSGNVHGMPLAVLLGHGPDVLLDIGPARPVVKPHNVAIVALRDVDSGEANRIRKLGIQVFTMREIDDAGTGTCMRQALDAVMDGTGGFHISFDMDSLDPGIAPGVGTPVPGGLTYREAHLACEMAADTRRLISMDVVETNPILDEKNRTGELAVELILSSVGKRIY